MKNFRVRRIHIVCLAIATAEILIAAFVLWKNAIWNETKIQTASKQSVLLETQEETTSGIQESEKTATQNQEETKPAEEAVSSMPSMRVKLKNSDNTSFEHAKVIITCPDTFHIQSGTKEQIFTGGQTVTITPEHPFFQEGSIRVASEGGFVIIDSILRRGISHEYEGVLDLYLGEQGIVIVNELPLEDYVSKVVPSEMPVSYGLEAAKLQAVCARTYAYERILHQKTIDNYGSFVDDSVDYQVYNSAGYQEISAQGAKLTSGVIMTRDGAPIVPYYFSTSCGYTADNLAWYRWRCEIPLDVMQELFLKRLPALSASQSECIKAEGESLEKIISSTLTSVQVTGRFAGGMASGLKLTYEKGSVLVTGELIMRKLLSEPNRTYQNKSEETVSLSEGNYLPSAFFCLIPVTNQDTLTGYVICGGGNGHGIGLSQNCAYQLLEQGKTWQEILLFFYQGIAFDTITW